MCFSRRMSQNTPRSPTPAARPSSSGEKIGESAAVELADGSKEIEEDPLANDPRAAVMIVKYPSGGFDDTIAAAVLYLVFISAL